MPNLVVSHIVSKREFSDAQNDQRLTVEPSIKAVQLHCLHHSTTCAAPFNLQVSVKISGYIARC